MLIPFDGLWRRHKIKAPGVVHIGASLGQEAETYKRLGIKRVIWIEALPSVYAKLIVKLQDYPTHIALNACVSDVDGQHVKFNIASNEAQSSSMLEFGTHSTAHPDVTFIDAIELVTTRVDTLFKKHNIQLGNGWFLNVDVQGAELLALKGMGELLWHFDYAYIEVNWEHLYSGCPLVGDIDDYMETFKLYPKETLATKAKWGDCLYCR